MKKVLAVTLAVLMVRIVAGCDTGTGPFTAAEIETATVKSETPNMERAQESQEPSASGDPIRAGLTTALTGDRSLEGEYASNTVKIIAEEINTQGGVLGRPVETAIEDALGTDMGAVNAYRKPASDDSTVATVGPNSFNDGTTQSPNALEFKMLTTVRDPSLTLKSMCNNDNPYLFQLRVYDDTFCTALIKYSVGELGTKSYAIMHDTKTLSADQAKLLTEALKSYGIEPVVTVPSTTGTKDFFSHIAQVQASGVDAIIGAALQTEAAILIQQVRSLGIEVPVLSSSGFADPVTIQLTGELSDSVYCASAQVPNTPNPKGATLAEKYKELYDDDCGKAAIQTYGHISVICEAITLAGSADRETVREAMNTIGDYQRAITKYDRWANGNYGRGGLLVEVVRGEAEVISEITSEKVTE